MTPEQTTLVQTSFAQVAPVAETAATLFYDRLFELNPSLRGLFKEDLRERRLKLMAMLPTAVNNLHQWDAVAQHLKQRGLPHVGYGVKPTDYDTIGTALIDTLEKGRSEAFTPPVRHAWIATPRSYRKCIRSNKPKRSKLEVRTTQSSVPSNPNGD